MIWLTRAVVLMLSPRLCQMYVLGVLTTLATIASVSPVFIAAFAVLCVAYSQCVSIYLARTKAVSLWH